MLFLLQKHEIFNITIFFIDLSIIYTYTIHVYYSCWLQHKLEIDPTQSAQVAMINSKYEDEQTRLTIETPMKDLICLQLKV